MTCSCGAFIGRLSGEEDEFPAIFRAVVNGRYDGHAARMLEAVGDQSAADALDTLQAHRAAVTAASR